MLPMRDLLGRHAGSGRLVWIGVRPEHRESMRELESVRAIAGCGLDGDHYPRRPGGPRQVTLIQAEHLPAIAALSGLPAVAAGWLRRNLVIEGINLIALKDVRFTVGEVLFEGSGLAHPCSRMEKVLGYGGYNAMRGHGGITAKVLEGGVLRVGDAVVPAIG